MIELMKHANRDNASVKQFFERSLPLAIVASIVHLLESVSEQRLSIAPTPQDGLNSGVVFRRGLTDSTDGE